MIQDVQELAASLEYAAKWADTLEGLRHHAKETDTALLPTMSSGPLSEVRRVLAEAREFVVTLNEEQPRDYHLSEVRDQEKAA